MLIEFFRRWGRDRFARRVVRQLQLLGVAEVSYDAEKFQIRANEAVINLANFHLDWKQGSSTHRRQVLAHLAQTVRHISQPPAEIGWPEARERLVPVVRERYFLECAPADRADKLVAFEPVSRWFVRALVLDFPNHSQFVNAGDLERWGVSFGEALAVGLETLRAHSKLQFRLENGVFRSAWDDDYDCSRLLLPGLLAKLEVRGAPIVTMPARNILLVAGSEDPDSIHTMLGLAEQLASTLPRPQNFAPLILQDGEWQDFATPPGSPIHEVVERARYSAPAQTYADQQARLQQEYHLDGQDIYVAEYKCGAFADGTITSYAVWTRGAVTSLPQADFIVFFEPDEPARLLGRLPWARVQAEFGDLLQQHAQFPPRYRVSSFPDEQHLQRCVAEEDCP